MRYSREWIIGMSDLFSNECITDCNLAKKIVKLKTVLTSQDFLNNEGLNNEVPFYICPYLPNLQVQINQLIVEISQHLQIHNKKVLEINLYDLALELLQKEEDLQWILDNELTLSRSQLKEELQGILNAESHLVPAIDQKMEQSDFDLLLITGVGEVFPYIRSHNVLNHLQKYAKDKPSLMFFPGNYKYSPDKGQLLNLFTHICDDKYYRAFNILERAI